MKSLQSLENYSDEDQILAQLLTRLPSSLKKVAVPKKLTNAGEQDGQQEKSSDLRLKDEWV